jgi:thiol-disulfide isomerase/thioredoxin
VTIWNLGNEKFFRVFAVDATTKEINNAALSSWRQNRQEARLEVRMKRMIVCLVLASALALIIPARAATDLPRYKFKIGQELVYSGSSDFDFGSGAFKDSDTITFWVTGQNPDGSWHLLYSDKHKNARTGDSAESNETKKFGSLNLFPDGRTPEKPATLSEESSTSVFIPLPADASKLKEGWEFSTDEAVQTVYHVKTPAAGPDGSWVIESAAKGIFRDIYLMTSAQTIYLDGARGLIEKSESENGQGYGFQGHGKGVMELKSDTIKDKDWITQLAWEADVLERAKADAQKAVDSVQMATAIETAKTTARQALQAGADRVKNPIVQAEFESELKNLDRQFRYAQEENERTDAVLNKPAAAWATTDLDGRQHALEDYRGKVVALDFWYRGCGWCMRAMPQVKALADQFRGQPVVILGMNTDREDKDARFVIDKLQLNYATLHGQGVPEKYGVRGFPTFIVIDQKGIVRARHVGYSPTLRQEMAKTIDGLLANTR